MSLGISTHEKHLTHPLVRANDMATMFPRYINIRRGQLICAILGGWCMVPWSELALPMSPSPGTEGGFFF